MAAFMEENPGQWRMAVFELRPAAPRPAARFLIGLCGARPDFRQRPVPPLRPTPRDLRVTLQRLAGFQALPHLEFDRYRAVRGRVEKAAYRGRPRGEGWWRRRESNPRPEKVPAESLHACSALNCRRAFLNGPEKANPSPIDFSLRLRTEALGQSRNDDAFYLRAGPKAKTAA